MTNFLSGIGLTSLVLAHTLQSTVDFHSREVFCVIASECPKG